jgi:hypothetical protein
LARLGGDPVVVSQIGRGIPAESRAAQNELVAKVRNVLDGLSEPTVDCGVSLDAGTDRNGQLPIEPT